MHESIVDNGITPHILTDASNDQVQISCQFEEDGKIVLNIRPTAVQLLDFGIGAVILMYGLMASRRPYSYQFNSCSPFTRVKMARA